MRDLGSCSYVLIVPTTIEKIDEQTWDQEQPLHNIQSAGVGSDRSIAYNILESPSSCKQVKRLDPPEPLLVGMRVILSPYWCLHEMFEFDHSFGVYVNVMSQWDLLTKGIFPEICLLTVSHDVLHLKMFETTEEKNAPGCGVRMKRNP